MSGIAPHTHSPDRNEPWLLVLFSILVALYCGWILLLPIFPSQDGPMHLYFTHVLAQLLSHRSPLYEHYYTIRHLLPPYSLYYYLLIGISHFVPLIWADKLVVVLAVATLAFGVRYLCTSVGRSGAAFAMLFFPVLFNWPLFMGFVNFTVSLGMGAFALGLWTRLAARPRTHGRIVFALLLATMTLTHPVPVGLVLVYGIIDLAMRFVDTKRLRRSLGTGHAHEWRPSWTVDFLLLAGVGICCAAYVSAFTVQHITEQIIEKMPFRPTVHWLVLLHGLLLFGGRTPAVLFYRAAVYLALFIPLAFAIWHVYKRRLTSAPAPLPRWLILALVVLFAMPVIPADLNHSHLFRDRLMIVIWIAALAAASTGARLHRREELALVAYGSLMGVCILPIVHREVMPTAKRVAEIEHIPVTGHGPVGLVLPAKLNHFGPLLFFDAYQWAGAHYPRRADGVLLNTPWLNLPIIPLGMKQGLLTDKLPLTTIERYDLLDEDLIRSQTVRDEVYPITDYALLVDQTGRTPLSPPDPVLAADTRDRWACEKYDWIVICDRQPGR